MKKINSLPLSLPFFRSTKKCLITLPHLLVANQYGGISLLSILILLLLGGLLFCYIWFSLLFVQKSKLEDVLEQAAIAVAVNNNENRTAAEIEQNRQIVRHYLSDAFPSMRILTPLQITCHRRIVNIHHSAHLNIAAIQSLINKDEPCDSTVNTTDMLSKILINPGDTEIEAEYEKTYRIENAGISLVTWRGIVDMLPASTPFTSILGSSAAILPVTLKLKRIHDALSAVVSGTPTLKPPKLPPIHQQVPIDLIFTADFSESMEGQKLKTLKQELIKVLDNRFFSNRVGKESRVGVVPFDEDVLDENLNCYHSLIKRDRHRFEKAYQADINKFITINFTQSHPFFKIDKSTPQRKVNNALYKYYLDGNLLSKEGLKSLGSNFCRITSIFDAQIAKQLNIISSARGNSNNVQEKFNFWLQDLIKAKSAPTHLTISEEDLTNINNKYPELKTLFDLFMQKTDFNKVMKKYYLDKLIDKMRNKDLYPQHIINLTNDKGLVKNIFSLFDFPGGGTDIVNGVLVSTALFLKSAPTPKKYKKIMFILSDGADNNAKQLNAPDLFEPNKSVLTSFCDQVKKQGIDLYFLGIEYNKQHPLLDWENKCVGSKNFYTLTNINQFADKVFKAIVQVQQQSQNQSQQQINPPSPPQSQQQMLATLAVTSLSAKIVKQGMARNINI